MDPTTVNLVWASLVVFVEWPLAFFVFLTAPGRNLNRLLGLFLFLETIIVSTYNGFGQGAPDGVRQGLTGLGAVAISIAGWVYLLFLGTVLNTPLVAWLKRPAVRWLLIGLAAACAPLYFFMPEQYGSFADGPDGVQYVPGGLLEILFNLGAGLLFLFGFLAAVHAYLRAPRSTVTRERSKIYAWSFGLRDLVLGAGLVLGYTPAYVYIRRIEAAGLNYICLIVIVYVLILAYAVLRWELFDIEVKIKWGIRRGTLAGIFLACFFIVNQLVEVFAGRTFGAFAGAVAAGLLLFALRPLERLSSRVADAAMPMVKATPDYVAFRKLEVYRAALESAVEGGVSDKERRTLEALRAKLGIARSDADLLERDAKQAIAG